MIKKARPDVVAQELFKLGQRRICCKWYTANLLVVPAGRAEFIERGRTRYGLDVRRGDTSGSGEKVVAMINRVADEKCENRIGEMVSPDHEVRQDPTSCGIVAVTAVYFHPWWNVKFDRNKTVDAPFYETPVRERRVKMMCREEVLPYVEGEVAPSVNVRMVGLACRRQGGTVYFVVPVNRFGLGEVIQRADARNLTSLTTRCVPRSVILWLPKLRLSETMQLRDDTQALGMRTWTAPNLPGIMDDEGRPLFINEMLHQAVVRFNEDGDQAETGEKTEADQPSEKSIKVRCDQPFLFRHEPTDAFWLIGSSSRPIYPKK